MTTHIVPFVPLHFAPLQGYTDDVYRRAHALVYGPDDGAASFYYTPFLRLEKGETRRIDLARLARCRQDNTTTVSQIIFGSVQEFDTLAAAVKDAGFDRIDINLGCPFAMQTRRGRGAAMIADVKTMAAISDIINADTNGRYSIKMRLGLSAPDEWKALMPILNNTRLEHVALHPRIATQLYKEDLYADIAAEFIAASDNPVIYNGDIFTPTDINRVTSALPKIKGIMIGRGMLARPSLMAEARQGREWSRHERLSRILDLHSRVYADCVSRLCGDTQVLSHLKPFWEYLEAEIGHKAYKAIKKATRLDKYDTAVSTISSARDDVD